MAMLNNQRLLRLVLDQSRVGDMGVSEKSGTFQLAIVDQKMMSNQ